MLKKVASLLVVLPNIFIFCAVLGKITSVTAAQQPRGVSLSRASLYNANVDFTCLDGSATIPFKYVNDDYCDCQDGSDEPGTSACPNGSFYCKNAGHVPSLLPSSRVNDGICDCCDGADEYESGTGCVNTCTELGAVAREESQRKYELETKGYSIKMEYINQGKAAKAVHEEKLVALKAELVEVEALKAEKERQKKEAEEPEQAALEKYRLSEQENVQHKEEEVHNKQETEASDAFDWLDTSKDGKLQVAEIQNHLIFDQNKDGVVSEEEAKFFLHMDYEMDKSEFISTGWLLLKPYFLKEQDAFVPPPSEELPAHESEEEPEIEEGSDEEAHEEAEVIKPATGTVEYDPETQLLIEAANNARNAYEEMDRRVREIGREIRQLDESASKDYGVEEEFQALEGHCFEYQDREYTYKLCPFDNGSQRPKHGGSETRLGSWGSWDGPAEDRYSKMVYDKGVQCWNGPQRSITVHLTCGMENQVMSVSEPNRCEYEMKFTTPAVCNEPLKPDETVDSHDEL